MHLSLIAAVAALASVVVSQTYEAETGALTGVTVDTTTPGYTGTGYVTGFDDAADNVAITIQTPSYGVYSLSIKYRSASGDKKANILLNGVGAGEVDLVATTTFSTASAGKLLLSAGANVITIQNDWGWYDIDSITLAPAPLPPATGTFQAEDGILTGGVHVANTDTGYSGTGYVTGFAAGSDSAAIIVNAPSYGVYNLVVLYRGPNGDKKTSLAINGVPSGEVSLPASATFTSISGGKVLLNAGSNIISFTNDWGWYDIDAVTITLAPAPPAHKANLAPVNPKASKQARSLLKYLQKKYGKYIISGQQDPVSAQWINTTIGKTPAIVGFDMIEYSPSRVLYGSSSNATEDAIAWDKKGGITTFVWHWNAPTHLINTDAHPWWSGFYTVATTFNLSAALANTSSTEYKLLLSDMDVIAEQLKKLKKAKIPVLWRPLHEAGGGWFWWGASGPDACKKLYRLMYTRFTERHKLDNLLWVWSSPEPAWYPGDDVVDVLGYDSYPAQGDHGPVSSIYDTLITTGKDRKIVTLSEVGSIPDPDLLQVYHADWSYWVSWTGDYINGPWNPVDFLKKVYTNKYVITLDKVGNFKDLV